MSRRGWALARAIGLALTVALLSPISPLVLVCVPLAVLLLAFHSDNGMALALGALILVAAFLGLSESPDPLWYAARAWALLLGGGFVLASLVLRRRGVLARSIGALGVAGAGLAAFGLANPAAVGALDWEVSQELGRAARLAFDWLGGEAWERMGATVQDVVEVQTLLYPAFLALASLAALGVGCYVVRRFEGAGESLGEFRDFRFSDQLIWVLIGGLLLFLLPAGEAAARLGENAMVFMGGLYLLRGIAVLAWVGATLVTSAWTAVLCTAVALFLYPLVAGAALVIGVSDTWLDVRARLGRGAGGARGDG